MMRSLGLLVVVSTLLAGCTPPLDEDQAAQLARALDTVNPEQQPVVAARGLEELERGRLGDALADSLDALVSAAPDERSQKVAMGLQGSEARRGWSQVCRTDYDEQVARFASAAPADGVRVLMEACDLGRIGLQPADPAKVDGMYLIVALIVYGAIERRGSVHPVEKRALALMAARAPETP
ncbi:MAG TPA: hypothetical protein VGB85_11470 [Nannocystis sp.]|jgi:hypothetical protein